MLHAPKYTRRRLTIVMVSLLLALPAVAGRAPSLMAAPVAGTASLNGIVCQTTTVCIAVGTNSSGIGIVVPVTSGVAGTVQTVSGTQSLSAIRCSSSSTCFGVGTNGSAAVVVPIASGSPGAVQVVASAYTLTSVACPSSTTCLAVGTDSAGDAHGVLVPITNGIAGSAQIVTGTVLLNGIYCPTGTSCLAVGVANANVDNACAAVCGILVPITSGVAGSAQTVAGTVHLNGIVCASSTSCVAVGTNATGGVVVPISSGSPGAVQNVAGVTLAGVRCPTAATCYAVGESSMLVAGAFVTIASGSAGSPQTVAGTAELSSIACTTSTVCDAVGQSPSFAGVVVPVPAGSVQTVTGTSQLVSISCVSVSFCVAVGQDSTATAGTVVPVTNGIAGATQTVAGASYLSDIFCLISATDCLAVGWQDTTVNGVPTSAGVLFELSGATGAVVNTTAIPDTTKLLGIGCPSVSTCYAVGWFDAGKVNGQEAFDGAVVPMSVTPTAITLGTIQHVTDIASISAISCPDATCYGVGGTDGDDPPLDESVGVIGQVDSSGFSGPDVPAAFDLTGISCREGLACIAVGLDQSFSDYIVGYYNGMLLPVDTSLGSFEWLGDDCFDDGECAIAGEDSTNTQGAIGRVTPTQSGHSATGQTVTGTSVLSGIACATSSLCYAVGQNFAGTLGAIVPFTVPATPAVTSVSPASGLHDRGTVVTISGAGFTGATAVTVGGIAATTFTVNSDTQITATVAALISTTTCVSGSPSSLPCAADIVVTTPGGSTTTGAADQFSYTNAQAGDVNGSGKVDSTDALCVLRYVAKLPPTPACPLAPSGSSDPIWDLDHDGDIDSTEALCILRHVAMLAGTAACPSFAANRGPETASRPSA